VNRTPCCARSEQTAIPPISVMNSRRLMSDVGLLPPWRRQSAYRPRSTRATLNAVRVPGQFFAAAVKLAAFNHFYECSELIEIEVAHGYKFRFSFP
jgi:hypothetical protein